MESSRKVPESGDEGTLYGCYGRLGLLPGMIVQSDYGGVWSEPLRLVKYIATHHYPKNRPDMWMFEGSEGWTVASVSTLERHHCCLLEGQFRILALPKIK